MAVIPACPSGQEYSWPAEFADGFSWAYCGDEWSWFEPGAVASGYVVPVCDSFAVGGDFPGSYRCAGSIAWLPDVTGVGPPMSEALASMFTYGFVVVAAAWGLGRGCRELLDLVRR